MNADLSDEQFIAGFDAGTLDGFPHEDHLRLVYALLERMPPRDALEHVRLGLLAMATRNGKPTAYHDTRTVAWFRLIEARPGGAERHPELLRRDPLGDYYSTELLDASREHFVEPDLKALD